MAQLSEILAIMPRLGVRDPKNPSAKDFKVVLDAYLKDKSLDTEAFNTYVKSLPAPLKVMCEGFAQFSADSREVSKRVLDVIERAMDVLQEDLRRENISADERREGLEHVLRLVAEARDESEKERTFRARLAYVTGGTVLVGAGVAVFVWSRGKNTEIMTRGVEVIGKAIAKAV
jgi:hypothetical protein